MQVCSSAGRHVSTVQNLKGGDSVVHKLLLFFKFSLINMVIVGKIYIIDDKAQISSGVVNGGTFWPTARRFAESVIHSNAAGWPTIVAANRTASIFQQKHNDEQGFKNSELENWKNKKDTKVVLSPFWLAICRKGFCQCVGTGTRRGTAAATSRAIREVGAGSILACSAWY